MRRAAGRSPPPDWRNSSPRQYERRSSRSRSPVTRMDKHPRDMPPPSFASRGRGRGPPSAFGRGRGRGGSDPRSSYDMAPRRERSFSPPPMNGRYFEPEEGSSRPARGPPMPGRGRGRGRGPPPFAASTKPHRNPLPRCIVESSLHADVVHELEIAYDSGSLEHGHVLASNVQGLEQMPVDLAIKAIREFARLDKNRIRHPAAFFTGIMKTELTGKMPPGKRAARDVTADEPPATTRQSPRQSPSRHDDDRQFRMDRRHMNDEYDQRVLPMPEAKREQPHYREHGLERERGRDMREQDYHPASERERLPARPVPMVREADRERVLLEREHDREMEMERYERRYKLQSNPRYPPDARDMPPAAAATREGRLMAGMPVRREPRPYEDDRHMPPPKQSELPPPRVERPPERVSVLDRIDRRPSLRQQEEFERDSRDNARGFDRRELRPAEQDAIDRAYDRRGDMPMLSRPANYHTSRSRSHSRERMHEQPRHPRDAYDRPNNANYPPAPPVSSIRHVDMREPAYDDRPLTREAPRKLLPNGSAYDREMEEHRYRQSTRPAAYDGSMSPREARRLAVMEDQQYARVAGRSRSRERDRERELDARMHQRELPRELPRPPPSRMEYGRDPRDYSPAHQPRRMDSPLLPHGPMIRRGRSPPTFEDARPPSRPSHMMREGPPPRMPRSLSPPRRAPPRRPPAREPASGDRAPLFDMRTEPLKTRGTGGSAKPHIKSVAVAADSKKRSRSVDRETDLDRDAGDKGQANKSRRGTAMDSPSRHHTQDVEHHSPPRFDNGTHEDQHAAETAVEERDIDRNGSRASKQHSYEADEQEGRNGEPSMLDELLAGNDGLGDSWDGESNEYYEGGDAFDMANLVDKKQVQHALTN